MSETTVKALTDAIYDALEGSDPVRDLDNEQVYEVARLAAQTIESAGTTKAIVQAWLAEAKITANKMEWAQERAALGGYAQQAVDMRRWAEAIREVSS